MHLGKILNQPDLNFLFLLHIQEKCMSSKRTQNIKSNLHILTDLKELLLKTYNND